MFTNEPRSFHSIIDKSYLQHPHTPFLFVCHAFVAVMLFQNVALYAATS